MIDNTSHPRLGAQQYSETLPLADREVVLTFDDGPLGPYTTRILDLLAAECVKATYFLVGTMARENPALVQRILKEGHTVGTHSRSHPLTFNSMPLSEAERQIDGGIALVKAALGDKGQLAPFFRIPGLLRSSPVENLLAQRQLVTWSVDLVADDWHRGISADEIAKRALRRLDARGRGILLLHDIHPATALAVPTILKGLKARGFRVVHVVPASASRPKTYTEPQHWASYGGKRSRVVLAEGVIDPRRPVPSRLSLDIGLRSIAVFNPAPEKRQMVAAAGDDFRLPRGIWTNEDHAVIPKGIMPAAVDINWPGQARYASTVTNDEAAWPATKPVSEPTHTPMPRSKAATRSKSTKPKTATACRSERCKKSPVGHQLSLTRQISPSSLRSQYSF